MEGGRKGEGRYMALEMSWQPSLLHQKRKNGPPLGLRNLGNSCYLNSVLQCLTYTPPLANFCLKNQHSSSCDASSVPDKKRDCPFCILEKQIARSLSIDLPLDSPAKLVSCLRLFSEHFKCGRQEDAHEFLRYVIDSCHNTCLRVKKLQQQHRKVSNGGAGDSLNGNSIVKEIFGGALQSQVKCLSCGAESNKVDEIMDICLEILNSNSLKDAMQKFFQPEILDGSNKYNCEKCKKLVAARKQMSILEAPNILVIQLKRFEGIFGSKIDRSISFEETMVLSSFTCKTSRDPRPEYRLFGTVVHSGFSPESGHYYAYIKDAMGRWYCCNDSFVTLSTAQEVLSEKVYMLFFTRTNQKPAPPRTSVAGNGVKSLNRTSGENTKVPNSALPPKMVKLKSSNDSSIVKGVSALTRVDKESSGIQAKFSGLATSLAKRESVNGNGKADGPKNLEVRDRCVDNLPSAKKSAKTTSCIYDENGKHSAVNGENSHPSENGNRRVQNGVVDPVKEDIRESSLSAERQVVKKEHSNGGVCNGGNNGHVERAGSKRKLDDKEPCILLSKDAQSVEKLEEFKEHLKKEASSFLRTCGWSEEVSNYMRSRKRLHLADHSSPDYNELQKLLIADAKGPFNSKIPESLKGKLIGSLRSFSQGNQS